MPWCEECAKYWTPSAMTAEGTCPACGRPVDVAATAANVNVRKLAGDESERAPWHFKLLMGLLALYFVWRVIDLFR
jgi:hypothetical protein